SSQLVGPSHHFEVAPRDVPHAPFIELERPLSRVVLRERGGYLLLHHQDREFHAALSGAFGRPRRGDVPFVPVAPGKRDANGAAEVVEDVLDRTALAAGRQAVQVEAEILTLITDADTGIPAPFGLLLLP